MYKQDSYEQKREEETNEIVFWKNNEVLFRMIPVSIKPVTITYTDHSVATVDVVIEMNKSSPQYIVVSTYNYQKVMNRLMDKSNPFYYDEAICYYDQEAFKQYTEEVFNDIADRAESKDNGASSKDYGVDDEFTYAYIMAHTEPNEHKYLRFYNWETIKGENRGWASLTNWKKQLKLPKIAKTGKVEYYKIPTCIGNLSCESPKWHIFSVVYKVDKDKHKTIMFHDNLNIASIENNFPKAITNEIKIKELRPKVNVVLQNNNRNSQKTSNTNIYHLTTSEGAYTACAFATVNFFKQTNNEIEQFNDNKTVEELQNKLNEIQNEAQKRITQKKIENQQSVNTKNDKGPCKHNNLKPSQGLNLDIQKTNINATPNTINTSKNVQNEILHEKQQQAEQKFIKRIKSAREDREKIFKKYSTTYYNESSIYKGKKSNETWAEYINRSQNNHSNGRNKMI